MVPAGRRGTVEDIASAVCYLASDEASYITGTELVIDGGMMGPISAALPTMLAASPGG